MEILKVDFENCFGIEKLENHEFDFTNSNVNIIYAKNGSMKTSFAKIFTRIQDGTKDIKEEIFFDRKTNYEILIDGNEISHNDIYVINSLDLNIKPDISSLLVNKNLKKEYEKLNNSLENKLKSVITKLNKNSGVKKDDIIKAIFADFKFDGENIYEFFKKVISDNFFEDLGFKELKYKDIFLDKNVLDLLQFPGFKDNIKEYYKKYNEIIEKTPFFEDGKFTLDNIYKLKKSIEDEKLYSVDKNGIFLNDKKYNSYKELEKEINDIMEIIRKDKGLTIVRDKIENGTKSVEKFDSLIKKHGDKILLNLNDVNNFKKNLWKNYFFICKNDIEELIKEYDKNISKIKEIIKEAKKEKTEWEKIIERFNNKFDIPFEIDIDDKINSVLGFKEPNIIFKYFDKRKNKYIEPLGKKSILEKRILSGGELRALYLLFVLFDIESFKKEIINNFEKGKEFKEKLFIIDDIADSFDYKNKYAIVEYLKELKDFEILKYCLLNGKLEDEKKEKIIKKLEQGEQIIPFYSIILTHNFDFFRFVSSRLKLNRNNKFHSRKLENFEIKIEKEHYQKNPFNTWKEILKAKKVYDKNYTIIDAKKHILALIPFVRNLIDFGDDKEINTLSSINKDKLLLTNLLHIKSETQNITIKNLKEIYKQYIGKDDFDSGINEDDSIYNLIIDISENHILNDDIKLENKIILAIVIRLKAEEFMINKISDTDFVNSINKDQARELFNKIIELNLCNIKELKILEKVNIMTPENIHLNSFMYEPILDMDIVELKKLYEKVKCLGEDNFEECLENI